jgi:hypothetical protein
MYKLINNIYGQLDAINKTNEDGIMLSIPVNPDNTDYQEYLKWVAEGNTPLPADE